MTKSDAMWIGYWAVCCELSDGLKFWIQAIACGYDVAHWEKYTADRADAAMVLYSEYRRLLRLPKRRKAPQRGARCRALRSSSSCATLPRRLARA